MMLIGCEPRCSANLPSHSLSIKKVPDCHPIDFCEYCLELFLDLSNRFRCSAAAHAFAVLWSHLQLISLASRHCRFYLCLLLSHDFKRHPGEHLLTMPPPYAQPLPSARYRRVIIAGPWSKPSRRPNPSLQTPAATRLLPPRSTVEMRRHERTTKSSWLSQATRRSSRLKP